MIPAAMVLILLAVQACLWEHASSIVQAAATQGTRAASVTSGSLPAGIAEARTVLQAQGSQLVSQPTVTASLLPGDLVWLRVTANAESIIPGFHFSVSAEGVGVREEFRVSG